MVSHWEDSMAKGQLQHMPLIKARVAAVVIRMPRRYNDSLA